MPSRCFMPSEYARDVLARGVRQADALERRLDASRAGWRPGA